MHRHPDIDSLAAQWNGRARRGFTLVEVLVALVVVVVGLLGVAGVSAPAVRAAGAAARQREAVTRAQSRLALLRSAGCGTAADGELREGGRLMERWRAGPLVNGVRLLEARAEWDDIAHRRAVVVPGALLC